jgi:hypothetical protein
VKYYIQPDMRVFEIEAGGIITDARMIAQRELVMRLD